METLMPIDQNTRNGQAKFKTIVVDPPWPQSLTGAFKRRENRAMALPYPTMNLDEISSLPVRGLADDGAHLWLWTTNQFLEAGFQIMRNWGFRYLAPITWVKPSGLGAWFVHRTQTILFGYIPPLTMRERYKPTVIDGRPGRHSAKPDNTYDFIESISESPRVELFAREQRLGWSTWGNECFNHVACPQREAAPVESGFLDLK